MGGASDECQVSTLDLSPSHLAVLKYQIYGSETVRVVSAMSDMI